VGLGCSSSKAGDNILKLTVKIRVTENGETNYRDIIVFDKTLDIKTNIKFSILVWLKQIGNGLWL
jgi:hypothetical protein